MPRRIWHCVPAPGIPRCRTGRGMRVHGSVTAKLCVLATVTRPWGYASGRPQVASPWRARG